MNTAIEKKNDLNDASIMESVLLGGDLSKLTSPQRISYYKQVCESLNLNPLTRPFDYLNLKGKLTLYAKKDATDQLRNIKGVSIDDVDITETATQFLVKVKGHDSSGRTDVEIGVVDKTDMQGNLANAQMKAVTKGKRRLTLSLCGLGWLDETEVETIPGAKAIPFQESGEIVDTEEDTDFAQAFGDPETSMTLETALAVKNSQGIPYGDIPTDKLSHMANQLTKSAKTDEHRMKLDACKTILADRAATGA